MKDDREQIKQPDFDMAAYIRLLHRAQGDRSLQTFAREAHLSPGNLSRVLHGQRATPETLRRIAEVSPAISYSELMAAVGYGPKPASMLRAPESTTPAVMLLPVMDSVHGSAKKLKTNKNYPLAPYPQRADGDFILFLANDDAFWPRFGCGAHVLVDITKTPKDGEIALLLLHRTNSLLRRVARSGTRWQLYGDNPAIPPENAAKSQVVIYGVAVAVTTQL